MSGLASNAERTGVRTCGRAVCVGNDVILQSSAFRHKVRGHGMLNPSDDLGSKPPESGIGPRGSDGGSALSLVRQVPVNTAIPAFIVVGGCFASHANA